MSELKTNNCPFEEFSAYLEISSKDEESKINFNKLKLNIQCLGFGNNQGIELLINIAGIIYKKN